MNAAEDRQYANADLEERGLSAQEITAEAINEQVTKLDNIIESCISKKDKRKAASLKKKLTDKQQKIDGYKRQIETAGQRSGYSKTDQDATAMRMKNDELLPAYNVVAGCEDQFIVHVSLHQNSNDGACFAEHLEKLEQQSPVMPTAIIADAIFGTEQNYEILENMQIENYLKFPSFQAEQKQSYQQNPFLKDNFSYDSSSDSYTCPNQKQLTLQASYYQTHKRTGYQSLIKEYQCSDCKDCPFYSQCCKSAAGENRLLKVNEKLEAYKQTARQNLTSEKGSVLRKTRCIEIETCYGDIKHNMGFRRFHLRGLKKAKTEFTLVAMAHNLRKLQLKSA